MSRTGFLVVCASVLSVAVPAPAASRPLSLAEAHELARTNNPTVRATRHAVASAVGKRQEARAARLPQFGLTGGYTRLSDVPAPHIDVPIPGAPSPIEIAPTVLNTYRVTAGMSAPLFTGFRLENAARAAEHLERAAGEDLRATQLDVGLSVDVSYWRLHAARAARATIAESVRLTGAYLADVVRMREVGMATDDDVLAVQVRLSEARLRLVEAEHAAVLARAALANVVSLPLDTEITLTDSLEHVRRPVPELTTLQQAARERRPELRAVDARLQSARRQVDVARGERLPSVMLSAGYEVSRPNQRYFPTEDAWHDSWSVGLGMSWTAWDWGITARRTEQARAGRRQVDERIRQVRDGIALETLAARLAVIEAARRIELAGERVAQAGEHYRSLREKAAAGIASTTEVLDAEVALVRARLDRTQALVDERLARARLDRATGGAAQ